MILLLPLWLLSKDVIVWSQYEFPPIYILSGENKGLGYEQQQEDEIRKYLKNYEHKIISTSVARTLYTIKNTKNTCSGLLKSKEREKYIYFSVAVNALVPNGLYIRKNEYKKFKKYIEKDGRLNLDKVVKSHKFKLAFRKLRSYGNFIDRFKKSDSFIAIDKGKVNLLLLLKSGRIDGYFTYSNEALKHVKLLGENPDDYMFLSIKGSSYTPTYIGCSKSKFGKKIIKEMNKYILSHRENTLLEHYLKWIDKHEANRIRKNIHQIFKKIGNGDN